MAKQWYIVHTFSGYEQKAKAALEERISLSASRSISAKFLCQWKKSLSLSRVKEDIIAEVFSRIYSRPDGVE